MMHVACANKLKGHGLGVERGQSLFYYLAQQHPLTPSGPGPPHSRGF